MSSSTELRLNATGNFILGLTADAISVILTQPLDVIKTHIQGDKWHEFRDLFLKTKGMPPIGKLWHGTLANCTGAIPQGGIPFVINGLTRKYLFTSPSLSEGEKMLSGVTTGLIVSAMIAPFDRVCKEQQFRGGSTAGALTRVVKREGMRGLFKAIGPIAARDTVVLGAFFGMREVVEERLQDHVEQDALRKTLASGTTGAFAGFLSNLPDRANTLMQGDKVGEYPSFSTTLQSIVRKEGLVKGLSKGAGIRSVFMAAYSISLGFAADKIKPQLPSCFSETTDP